MSKHSYIRINTPGDVEDDGVKAFRHSFARQFGYAGGTAGAQIVKIGTDAFNDSAKPMHCLMIKGPMSLSQRALVTQYA